jgi:hypothetical protein
MWRFGQLQRALFLKAGPAKIAVSPTAAADEPGSVSDTLAGQRRPAPPSWDGRLTFTRPRPSLRPQRGRNDAAAIVEVLARHE